MSYNTIIFERKENYALITLNRPDKLNALNTELFNELNDAITQIELDDSVKLVILTGQGEKAFAAGADIKELNQSDANSGRIFSQHGSNVMRRLESLKKPVIAAVNGFALGGGCELAMSCHIRFSSDNAKFGQPEVNLGILPGYGGTQRLPRLVGVAKAIELTISAKIIGAEEAKAIGLVNQVYPQAELMEKTLEFANLVLSKGTLAVQASIDAIQHSTKLSPAEGLAYESKLFGEICGTDDFKEGTVAFLEKRNPNFKN
jgi:enoyl-CoA hydratase